MNFVFVESTQRCITRASCFVSDHRQVDSLLLPSHNSNYDHDHALNRCQQQQQQQQHKQFYLDNNGSCLSLIFLIVCGTSLTF